MTRPNWYYLYGFRPPERSKLYKDGLPPKYFVKDSSLTVPNMHLDDISRFSCWFLTVVRRVIPGLVSIPVPITPPHPDITVAMIKEMMGLEPRGHTVTVRETLEKFNPELKAAWEKYRDELINAPNVFSSITARMPMDHESIPKPFSSTTDGIYPIRREFSIRD